MFGAEPSYAARKAAEVFKDEGRVSILELGSGQGRDTIFFARNGLNVRATDYSEPGLEAIRRRSRALGLSESITTLLHDVREPLPFSDESFDACFAHMLFCMALTTTELEHLSAEVRRVLKPGGLCVYTVRTTDDPDYGRGAHVGEGMYKVREFIIHFFSQQQVEHLASGYDIVSIERFEEHTLPRRLFLVTLRRRG